MEIIVNGKLIEFSISFVSVIPRKAQSAKVEFTAGTCEKLSWYEAEKIGDRIRSVLINADKKDKEIETLKSVNETLSIDHDEFMRLKEEKNELIEKIQNLDDFKTVGIERIKELEEENLKLRCCGNCRNETCEKVKYYDEDNHINIDAVDIDTCTLNRMKFWKGE